MLILQRFMYRDCSKTSCLLGIAGSSSEVICIIASFSVKGHIYVCVSTLPLHYVPSFHNLWGKCSCVCFVGTWWEWWLAMGSLLMMLLSRAAISCSCAVTGAFLSFSSKTLLPMQQSQQASRRYGVLV